MELYLSRFLGDLEQSKSSTRDRQKSQVLVWLFQQIKPEARTEVPWLFLGVRPRSAMARGAGGQGVGGRAGQCALGPAASGQHGGPPAPWQQCPPRWRPRGETVPQLPHSKEEEGGHHLPGLPVSHGQGPVPRALTPQNFAQDVKFQTLKQGLTSKARSGGRSQRPRPMSGSSSHSGGPHTPRTRLLLQ